MRHSYILAIFCLLSLIVTIDNVWPAAAIVGRVGQPFVRFANELSLSPEERQRRARDQRRIDDLSAIQSALDRYITDHGRPPEPASYGEDNAWRPFDTSSEGDFLSFLVPDYLKRVPVDPINTGTDPGQYTYVYTYYDGTSRWGPNEIDRYFYVLGARLENGQGNRFLDHEVWYWLGREFEGEE